MLDRRSPITIASPVSAYGLLKIVYCCGTAFFRFLSTDPSVSIVGVAVDYDSTVELPDRHQPTMLVTDLRMSPMSTDEGIRLRRYLRSAHPDIGVIVFSQYAHPECAGRSARRRHGGRGYLLKERVAHFDQLSETVHQVAAGRTVLDPVVVEALLLTPATRKRSGG